MAAAPGSLSLTGTSEAWNMFVLVRVLIRAQRVTSLGKEGAGKRPSSDGHSPEDSMQTEPVQRRSTTAKPY